MNIRLLLRSLVLWAVALVILMPILMTLGGSLMGMTELSEAISPVLQDGVGYARAPLFPALPTLAQYLSLLLDTPKFLTMFWNSIILVLPIVLGQAVVGTLAAWGFSHFRFPGREGLFMGYIALMMMPFQVTLVPTFLVLDRLNLMDTRWAVILPGIFSTFAVFILRQFFHTIPTALTEAATIDGAGELRIFATIAVPLGMPGVASLLVLSFLDNWNLIEPPMTFIKNQEIWPLSLFLKSIGQTNVDVALAASVITLLPALLLFLYGETYLVRGIRMAGLKE